MASRDSSTDANDSRLVARASAITTPFTCATPHWTCADMAEGGYDYVFLEPLPDRIICKICDLPCYEAEKSKCCGHVFCKSDLMKMKSSSRSYVCPMCRVKPLVTYPDRAIDREIKGLRIYCPYSRDGCKWSGELVNLEDHLNKGKNCVMRRCNRCKQRIHHTAMTSHTNKECPCYCQYCGITEKREVIRNQHKENCQKYPLSCPNSCGLGNILRCDMKKHKKVCPLEVVSCSYCGVDVVRKDEEWHKRESIEHVMLMCQNVYSDAAHKQAADHKKSIDLITQYNKACMNRMEENYNTISDKLDYFMYVAIAVAVLLLILAAVSADAEVPQSDKAPVLVAPIVFKMPGFAEKMKNAEQWWSPPFFAFWKGYQICLNVYVGGNDDTHLSAYLFLMNGPHDDNLAESGHWPFRGTFTIELLNQLSDNDHHAIKVSFDGDTPRECTNRVLGKDSKMAHGWGETMVISHEDILHCGKYLKNNILYFRISYEI